MEKLELKHISPYLPYGLKVKWGTRVIKMNTGQGSSRHWIGISSLLKWYNSEMIEKPTILLRPLSDLVKPMPSGEIPLVELAKIEGVISGNGEYEITIKDDTAILNVGFFVFEVDIDNDAGFCVYTNRGNQEVDLPVSNQVKLWEYLFANHFDVYSLIPDNLAVDINSIEV